MVLNGFVAHLSNVRGLTCFIWPVGQARLLHLTNEPALSTKSKPHCTTERAWCLVCYKVDYQLSTIIDIHGFYCKIFLWGEMSLHDLTQTHAVGSSSCIAANFNSHRKHFPEFTVGSEWLLLLKQCKQEDTLENHVLVCSCGVLEWHVVHHEQKTSHGGMTWHDKETEALNNSFTPISAAEWILKCTEAPHRWAQCWIKRFQTHWTF